MSQNVNRLVLDQLLKVYLEDPDAQVNINDTCTVNNVNPIEISNFLLTQGWIRDRQIFPANQVYCRITLYGIDQINPVWLPGKEIDIIEGLGNRGGSGNIMEILELDRSHYSIGLDLVNYLRHKGHIRLLAGHFPSNSLMAELTSKGKNMSAERPNFF